MPSKRVMKPSTLTKSRAKELRANASDCERLLWPALRAKQAAGLKFRRQHPVEPYIADFYCAAAKLVFELDGRSHDSTIEYDEMRTAYLRNLDIEVVRISNDDVLQNLEGVVESIVAQCLHTIQKTPPLAPPRSTGEGD